MQRRDEADKLIRSGRYYIIMHKFLKLCFDRRNATSTFQSAQATRRYGVESVAILAHSEMSGACDENTSTDLDSLFPSPACAKHKTSNIYRELSLVGRL